MKFKPQNRHLLVLPIEEKQEENNFKILTPVDYKKPESPYLLCEVLAVARDCKIKEFNLSDKVAIERRMLHKLDLSGETFYLVLENYVYGRLEI